MKADWGPVPEEYKDKPRLSSTNLRLFMQSPRHYQRRDKKETTPAMQFGTNFHQAVLEPEKWKKRLDSSKAMPDFPRKSKNQPLSVEEQRRQWIANNKDYLEISDSDLGRITEMVKVCKENEIINRLITHEDRKIEEKFWMWDGQILWTGRVDLAVPTLGVVADVKSTASAMPRKFDFVVDDMKLMVQAKIYKDAMESIYKKEFKRFVWIAVESKEPFNAVPFFCDFGALEVAQSLIDEYVPKFLECWKTDTWPGYVTGFKDAGIPPNRMWQYEGGA